MNLGNVILDVDSEHEIYFLLTSYVEALRYCGQLDRMPAPVARLPLAGLDDVRVRFSQLAVSLADTTHPLDQRTRVALTEAACVFGAALHRLRALEIEGDRAPALAAAA
jgi:hypothetical protein